MLTVVHDKHYTNSSTSSTLQIRYYLLYALTLHIHHVEPSSTYTSQPASDGSVVVSVDGDGFFYYDEPSTDGKTTEKIEVTPGAKVVV